MKETFEYTFDDMLGSMHDVGLICMLVMAFFAMHFEFIFVVIVVSNVNLQKM